MDEGLNEYIDGWIHDSLLIGKRNLFLCDSWYVLVYFKDLHKLMIFQPRFLLCNTEYYTDNKVSAEYAEEPQ